MQSFPRQWIERVIALDSVTDRSNESVIRFLLPLLEESGLQTELHRVREGSIDFFNLVARPASGSAPTALVLHTHLDTVSPGDTALWTETAGDPFRATFKGDKVFGLGTADVKLDFLCKLWAARTVRPNVPFALVGSYGEERGLIGTKKLLASRKVAPKFALVGEPSELQLIYAHKGHLIATVEVPVDRGETAGVHRVNGRAAHSSTPKLGSNAIDKALRWAEAKRVGILRLEGGTDSNRVPERCDIEWSKKAGPATRNLMGLWHKLRALEVSLRDRRDRRFTPSNITLSVNVASTRRTGVRITFDMRLLPSTDSTKLAQRIERLVAKHGKLVDLSVDPPLDGSPKSVFLREAASALERCGVKPILKTKASSTEAALYYQYGAEAVVFGPGISIGNVHRPNEHNLLSQLESATRFYSEMLASSFSSGLLAGSPRVKR